MKLASPLLASVALGGFTACDGTSEIEGLDDGQSALIALIDAASAPRLSVYGGQRSNTPFLE